MPKDSCAIGVDLGGHSIKLAVVDGAGTVRLRETAPTRADEGKDASVARIERSVKSFLVKSRTVCEELIAVGIGAPGLIDVQSGMVSTLAWHNNSDK